MKLNNKGFAVSTIMYMILILAVILIAATLSILSARKLILDNLKKEVITNIHSNNPLVINGTLTLPTVLTFSESTVTEQIAIENYTGTRYNDLVVKSSYGIDSSKITVNYPYINLTALDISNCDVMDNCTVTIGIPGTDVEDTMIVYYDYDNPTYILRFDTSEDMIPVVLVNYSQFSTSLPIYYSGPEITTEIFNANHYCWPYNPNNISGYVTPKYIDSELFILGQNPRLDLELEGPFSAGTGYISHFDKVYCRFDISIDGVVYDSRTFEITLGT